MRCLLLLYVFIHTTAKAQSAFIKSNPSRIVVSQVSTQLPKVTLTSASSGNSLAFSFGQVFKKGAVPAGKTALLSSQKSQTSILSTWDDGSVKHALIAGADTFVANTAKQFNFVLSTNTPVSNPLGESQLATFAPKASVTYGSYGTINLSTLINTSSLVLIENAGPEYTAFQYLASFPQDNSVHAVFYVQLWSGGKYRVRIAVENGAAQISSTVKSGLATVSIADQIIFSANVSMPDATRWDFVGSNTPDINVSHDAAYLRATKLIPNYGFTNTPAATITALDNTYTPMSRMSWEQDMGSPGYTPGIGLLPHWDAIYSVSGNPLVAKSSLLHSSALGSYSIFYRNMTTRRMVKFSDFPNAYANSESLQTNTNTNRWEIAHHPHAGYLPWLITGERFHLEVMQANAYAAWYTDSGGGQTGLNRLYVSQTRAKAWRYRTIAGLAAVSPDSDPFKAEAKSSVLANLKNWKTNWVDTNTTPTGLAATYSDLEPNTAGQQISLFEHFFLVASVGWSWDQDLSLTIAESEILKQVRDYLYRIPVGVTGRGQNFGEYCYQRAVGPYRTNVGPASTTFYTNWGDVYKATYADNLTCANGSDLMESYVDDASTDAFPQGNWGHLLTALSYAADHGAVGATDSYNRVTTANNWSRNATKFNSWPQYGVIKRD